MYGILKSTMNGRDGRCQSDTTAAEPDPNPTDPWLFTDPLAREIYQRQGRLRELEEDILTYVMNDRKWADDEVEAKFEFRRLLREGLLIPGYCFSYLSPHPTTYRAVGKGELKISGQRATFDYNEDFVFEPWLSRVSHPGHVSPIWIGNLEQINRLRLCCEAFPLICIHCDQTVAILRQTIKHPRTH